MPTGVVAGGLVGNFFLWELKKQGIPWAGGMPTCFSGWYNMHMSMYVCPSWGLKHDLIPLICNGHISCAIAY